MSVTTPGQLTKVAVRRAVRHPREILCLVIVIALTVGAMVLAGFEFTRAVIDAEIPNTYVVLLVAAPIVVWFGRGQLYAMQRLNGIEISPRQFPEAYAEVERAAREFGLGFVPDAYVVSGNGVINAAASGHGLRRYVFINSDLFEVGGRARNPDALRFIVGHEVGHIAAGHASYWRQLFTITMGLVPILGSVLSRAQEYTADNYGYRLRPQGAQGAMATLAGGKYLNTAIEMNEYSARAGREKGFFVWVVNAMASHPVLIWRSYALRDRRAPGRLLWRPRPAVVALAPPVAPPDIASPPLVVAALPVVTEPPQLLPPQSPPQIPAP